MQGRLVREEVAEYEAVILNNALRLRKTKRRGRVSSPINRENEQRFRRVALGVQP